MSYYTETGIKGLSNYATISDLKGAADIDRSKFAKNADLAGSKSYVEKLDVDKLETTPVDLSKLSNVVKNDFVYGTLVKKVMLFSLLIIVV